MKTIRKKTTGYKVENLKEDILQEALDNLPEGGGESGGNTTTSITLNLNPTDYPLPTTEGDYTIVIQNQDIITQLNSIFDDIENNIISPQTCSVSGSETSSFGSDLLTARYHLSGNVLSFYYILSTPDNNNNMGGAKALTLLFKNPQNTEFEFSEVNIQFIIQPNSVSGVIDFSKALDIYTIIENLYSASVIDAKIYISFIRI